MRFVGILGCSVINNITLWAMWKSVKPTTMQGFGNYCDQMNVNDTLTLRDTRDDNEYTIAKLKDNRCWMTQNLRLVGPLSLSSIDTNIKDSFQLPAPTNSGFGNGSTVPDIIVDYLSPNDKYKYGAYYPWITITAGKGINSRVFIEPTESICPKGWYLPTKTDYESLLNKYGSSASSYLQEPLNFTLTGAIFTSNISSQDTYGWYWTSTWSNYTSQWGSYIYMFVLEGGSAAMSSGRTPAGTGNPARCISE